MSDPRSGDAPGSGSPSGSRSGSDGRRERPARPGSGRDETRGRKGSTDGPPEPAEATRWRPLPVLLLVLGAVAAALAASSLYGGWSRAEISYSTFLAQLEEGRIEHVHVQGETVTGRFREPLPAEALLEGAARDRLPGAPPEYRAFETVTPPWAREELGEKLADKGVTVSAESSDGSLWVQGLIGFLPILLLIGLFWYGSRALQQRAQDFGGQGGPFGMGKSKARRHQRTESETRFSDVAGVENAKRDLQEIIDYLREPERYAELGAKLPRGVLLLGPPGTGKTLLARAVAGEADVAFYSISGSEFIETFVGVGAARVRSLFEDAKKEAPAVVFIDEIDSVGRSRGTGVGGGHDEREQTLNQILSEMDGFEVHEPVVVIAATNRPDVLDPALLRPGRFDRKVTLDLPMREARRQILAVHTRKVPLAGDVELEALARATVGFSGADLENLVNEAALLAGRSGRKRITTEDFEDARDVIALGHKREEALGEEERRRVAVHEGGHAILAERLPHADPLRKVTIVPRGHALGATEQVPQEEKMNRRRSELMDRIAVMLGGRAAEQVVYGEVSSGAAQDLKQATSLARRMVTEFGMGSQLGAASFSYGEQHVFLGKELSQPRDFSEHTAELIDEEIRALIGEAEARAVETLQKLRAGLEALTEALLERETLEQEEIAALLQRTA